MSDGEFDYLEVDRRAQVELRGHGHEVAGWQQGACVVDLQADDAFPVEGCPGVAANHRVEGQLQLVACDGFGQQIVPLLGGPCGAAAVGIAGIPVVWLLDGGAGQCFVSAAQQLAHILFALVRHGRKVKQIGHFRSPVRQPVPAQPLVQLGRGLYRRGDGGADHGKFSAAQAARQMTRML